MITHLLLASLLLQKPEKPVVTFAFFGCNRIDQSDWDKLKDENPSSANVGQFRQNMEDAAKLNPDFLFFGGDLVNGYADDNGEVLTGQVKAWIDLVKSCPKGSKTTLCAIAGNHEVNRKNKEGKFPTDYGTPIWSRLVREAGLIPKGRGATPKNSPEDKLLWDESATNYSLNRGPVHFTVLSTDTRSRLYDDKKDIGIVPLYWLKNDIEKAQKNPKVKTIVVLGHRNLLNTVGATSDAPISQRVAGEMTKNLVSNSKVKAYVCAHVHAYEIVSFGADGPKQVVLGNGGSKLEEDWNPAEGRSFGFGYFKVYGDGRLGLVPYFRPAPKNYLEEWRLKPAQPREEIDLSRP